MPRGLTPTNLGPILVLAVVSGSRCRLLLLHPRLRLLGIGKVLLCLEGIGQLLLARLGLVLLGVENGRLVHCWSGRE